MRNIRAFDTEEQFLATQPSGTTGEHVEDVVPGFAYIREEHPDGDYARFNDPSAPCTGYSFGEILYRPGLDGVSYDPDAVDSVPLSSIDWRDWDDSLGAPAGLVVVPSCDAPDGMARIIPLNPWHDADAGTWNDGGGWTELAFDYVSDEQYWYDSFQGATRDHLAPDSDYVRSPLYCSSYGAAYEDFPTDRGDYGYPLDEEQRMAVDPYGKFDMLLSPYLSGRRALDATFFGERPYDEPAGGFDDSWNACSDFSGYTWTELAPGTYYYGPWAMIDVWRTPGTNRGDWYIPALGEMAFLMNRFHEVDDILGELTGASLRAPEWQHAGLALSGVPNYGTTTRIWNGERRQGTSPMTQMAYFAFDDDYDRLQMFSRNVYERRDPEGEYFIHVIPFALAKDGKIRRPEVFPEPNGHRISDLQE